MAFVGLKYSIFAPIDTETEGAMPTYKAGMRVGRTMSADVTTTRRGASIDADDNLAEYDNSLTGVSITLGVDDVSDEVAMAMLGDMESDDGDVIEGDAPAAYGGYGNVRERRYKGVKSYYAYWYPKTTWSRGNESAATKSASSGFQTPTLEGVGMGVHLVDKGVTVFRLRRKFNTEAEAIAWINAKGNVAGA